MMLYTIKDIGDLLKKYKIKNFMIFEQFETFSVSITFYNVHWFSFFLKNKIERCKKYIKENKPAAVLFSYSISSYRFKKVHPHA
jgi:hypothetical protein